MSIKSLSERLERKILKRGNQDCWPWLGYINEFGEARVWIDDATGSIPVPRAIFLAQGITIPEGREALSCPILKDCCNPEHISLVPREEVADRILWRKGLVRRPPADRVPRRKLSDEQVKQIFLSKEETSVLARKYQVSEGQVSNIRAGRRHRDITDPLRQFQEKRDTEEGPSNRLAVAACGGGGSGR